MHRLFLLASGTDLSDCSCPPRCTDFVFDATVSSSRLSDVMTNYYVIRGNNDSEIEHRYVNAAETRNRVALSLISDIIDHLENLVTAYQRLKGMLFIDLIEPTTSVPGQIYPSINTIVQQTQDSVAGFSSQIADKFTYYYEHHVDIFVTNLVRSAKSVLSYQVYFADIDVNDTESYDISRVVEIINSTGNAFCNDVEFIRHAIKAGADFSTKLFLDRTCEDERFSFCQRIVVLVARMKTENNSDYVEELLRFYRRMKVSATNALKCAPMYGTFLTKVQSWLKAGLTMNSSLPLQPADRRYVLKELEYELSRLKAISRMFAEKSEVSALVYIYIQGGPKNWTIFER